MLSVSTEKSGVMLGGDVNRDGSDKGNPINTTGSTTGSVATTTALASDATADDTPHTTLVDSKTSSIAMNVVDEEDAMGRLLYDLSEDGVSMVIGIFGLNANSNDDSIKEIDDWFTPCSQFATEKKKNECNLIPGSRPPSYQEISPSQAQLDQEQDDERPKQDTQARLNRPNQQVQRVERNKPILRRMVRRVSYHASQSRVA